MRAHEHMWLSCCNNTKPALNMTQRLLLTAVAMQRLSEGNVHNHNCNMHCATNRRQLLNQVNTVGYYIKPPDDGYGH